LTRRNSPSQSASRPGDPPGRSGKIPQLPPREPHRPCGDVCEFARLSADRLAGIE